MPRPRPCLNCQALTRNRHGRCNRCQPQQPTTDQKGYDWRHQQARTRAKRLVDAGLARCARCGRAIHPLEPFDLDHHDHNRDVYIGVSHQRCNRGAPHRNRRGGNR
jgi:hypothetical protein